MHSGLSYLQDILLQNGSNSRIKVNPVPVFSLLSQLLSSLRDFTHSDFMGSWIEFLARSKKPNVLFHLIESWLAHYSFSLQCQLLSSLIICCDRRKLQLYIRMRKYIVQLASNEHLDEISLKHEDVLTVIHRMFPVVMRKEMSRGVKQLFMNFRVADAKIYGCVFIEFVLSIYDNTGDCEQSLMAGDTKISSQIQISNFSSIEQFSSNLHKQGGLCKAYCPSEIGNYHVIQTKFLPQEMERQKAYFGEGGQQSYYYSNSINFTEQSSLVDNNSRSHELGTSSANKENRSANNRSCQRQPFEPKQQILIEDSRMVPSNWSLEEKESKVPQQLRELVIRNEEFKSKMLDSGSKASLSYQDEESIRETINIIHNSVVRNHHAKQY